MEFDKNGILNRAKAAQQSAVVMDIVMTEDLEDYFRIFIALMEQT